MEWLMEIAKEYGLFVALVVYVIWDARNRELKYLAIIKTLSEEIKGELVKIKTRIGIPSTTTKK